MVRTKSKITNMALKDYDHKNVGLLNPVVYAFIWAFVFLLLTSAFIREEYIHFVDRQPMEQAKTWAPAVAQVGEFSVAPVYVSDGKMHGHEEYKVRVRYKYVVDGISHFAQQDKFLDYPHKLGALSRTEWGTPSFLIYSKATEEQMARDFAEGSQHVVRYDPRNPSVALIDFKVEPDGAGDWQRRMGILGALVLGLAICWVVSSGALKMR
jgi:hypothetical protein